MAEASMPDWAAVLFETRYRHICLHGGRGSGKSHAVARALLARACTSKLRILCVREIQNSIAQSIKQLLDDCIRDMGLGDFFHSTEQEIVGENGSQFIFAGLLRNIDSIKSKEGVDICWVEEAQSVSQRSIDVLIPTIRKPGSQIIWVWNPNRPDDPVDKMFRAHAQPDDVAVVEVNFSLNPWFHETTSKRDMEVCKQNSPDDYAHIWLGGYLIRSEASIFRHWHVVNDTTEPKMPLHLQPRYGADWGFSDPTVLVRCWVDNDKRVLYVDREAYGENVEVIDYPALFHTVEDSERWPIVADSSRPEAISHMRKHGFPKIMPSVKGPNSVEEGVKFLQGFTIYIHVECMNAINEFGKYSRKVNPKTNEVLDEIEDKFNHVIDALRYAVEGDRRGVVRAPPPKVTIIPTRTAWAGRRA